jgi:hypothetical protein
MRINSVRDFAWLSIQSIMCSIFEALRAFESVRAFIYAHDITERNQANIVNIERLLFSLKRKGDTKQMKINDYFKK